MREAPAGFVVKATFPSTLVSWLARVPFPHRFCLGPRDSAAVFHTKEEAESAIDQMPAAYKQRGFIFSVEDP